MGIWTTEVTPRLVALGCADEKLRDLRARACEGLRGEVVELGFGSGHNIGLYPPEVTRVIAVEPSDVAWQLGADRRARSSVPIVRGDLDGQWLSLGDESADAVLATFTLCTIPDVHRALSEVRRVLRPGGALHFLEHGLAPEPRVHSDLVAIVTATLAEHADAARAAGQQRYMKSAMPFLGLTSPQLKALLGPLLRDPGLAMESRAQWEATIRALWNGATHRAHWYAAIALARHRPYRRWVDSDAMPLWESLIRAGAWWDVVDDIATHLVRDTVLAHPTTERLRLRDWAGSGSLWVRRAAIICQVGAGPRVDQAPLADVKQPNL